ncbi:peroxiredoxin [Tropicibacter naphthalenivorans]|uniref:thioredoxin-dependent peroxiredoxin n=1 Tax=Tropicibacter naphthalenivorans TaxID=441103 RepID=A0A0P1GQ72_9RHOB|nr:peroxiredoxin [Tropicibacter naphthalenivorans]CUH76764.1 Putative peroxiredoxin bcp [Tropicibacter naphthalenivorans]SMC63150.1 peroxiredoxin Q/BCP [Tropicibacter naphthalenivorans]
MSELIPDVTLPGTSGEVSLSALKGTPFVLFFYPRDNTPGCTTENLDFTAKKAEFDALGVKLFGVSKDSLESHEKFVAKKELAVPLLSDEHTDLSERLGVWKEKKMYGKTFMGIERSTFLVNAAGEIVREWRKVKVAGHVDEVLEAAKAL